MSASRVAQLALRRFGGKASASAARPPVALLDAKVALPEQRFLAGGHRSSCSTAKVKEASCERAGWRHRPTTYEGSCEDGSWAQSKKPGGFSRSTFVTERRCTGGELRDSYEIGEELGAGATSKVYRAVKRRTGENVAVKIMSKSLVKDHQMLQNEIQIHKATDHPNILRLLEVFEDDRNLYLVTEICPGGDLSKLMNMNSDEYSAVVIPEDDATRLLQQVVNSVHYLHSQGIVHRDLKPSNFLVAGSSAAGTSAGADAPSSNKCILKLADFGVSAYCGEKHRLTRRVGTDGFMAPEISRNLPYDEKADIFSIGCILHMMLTGHPPKEKECGIYVTSKIRLQFVSPEMRSLVERCMDIDPEKRPSVQEIDELPLLKRMREEDWVNSARLDAQLLDQMYSYSSFPLLKKAALVAMVSRAESDSQFPSCIEKFMSLSGPSKQGVSAEDIYKALSNELVSDMERKAHRILSEPFVTEHRRLLSASAPRLRRRPRSSTGRQPQGTLRDCRERFASELRTVSEELANKISVDTMPLVSYSEWLAATVDASWYTDYRRIQATFRLFDVDGDGVISQDDLKKVMPNAFKHLDVREVLLESQHCPTQSFSGVREKDFALLLRTHKPSKYTLRRIRDGVEDPLLPS